MGLTYNKANKDKVITTFTLRSPKQTGTGKPAILKKEYYYEISKDSHPCVYIVNTKTKLQENPLRSRPFYVKNNRFWMFGKPETLDDEKVIIEVFLEDLEKKMDTCRETMHTEIYIKWLRKELKRLQAE